MENTGQVHNYPGPSVARTVEECINPRHSLTPFLFFEIGGKIVKVCEKCELEKSGEDD